MTELWEKYDNYIRLKYTSKSTISSYTNCYWKFIRENSRVYRMSKLDIEKYMIQFKSNYSVSYYNQMLSSLYILFNEILNQKRKTSNLFILPQPDTLQSILTVNEVRMSISKLSNFKHRTILCVLYLCGLRVSELTNLKINDINFNNLTITIRRSKGNKGRCIPITPKLLSMIEKYIESYNPSIFLIEGKNGKYSNSSVRAICKKVGINNPHLLRHSIATHLIDSGDSVLHVSPFLGHKSIKSTQKYHHLSGNSLRNLSIPN